MGTKTSTAPGSGRARAKTGTESTSLQKTPPSGEHTATHDEVAQRAHEIWIERGGDAQANWLQAEAELANGVQLPE